MRSIQRHAILTDPDYHNGNYLKCNKYPENGMRIARELGMICYRSFDEFNLKFKWEHIAKPTISNFGIWEVENYLLSKANSFKHYDPNCYLLLSKCTDLMDLGRGFSTFAEGLLRIGSVGNPNIITLGEQKDLIIPIDEQEKLISLLISHGRNAKFVSNTSIYGHDAFLLDFPWYSSRISSFLNDKNVIQS